MLSNQGTRLISRFMLHFYLPPLLAVLLISGCGGGTVAPVTERSVGSRPPPVIKTASPNIYRVRSGDTLYSIAWRYGKDFRGLARANNIDNSYRIYPGQELKLFEAPQVTHSSSNKAQKASVPVKSVSSKAKPVATQSVSKQPAKPKWQPVVAKNLTWRWPARGKVIHGFRASGKVNKGLNIAGGLGDGVMASAPGEVVYAGNGLLGYGNLIILNHNEQYLSAYAHNSKLLVKEKDWVKTGQKIAEMGDSGTTRTMLHFEIRKDGKPVNPLRYLPKRQ